MRLFAFSALVLIALTGCGPASDAASPTPTPTATATPKPTPTAPTTKPAIGDLVIGPDGLGPLYLGVAPPQFDPALDVLVYVEDYCQAAVDEGYLTDPGLWVANYPEALANEADRPFGVWVWENVIQEIAVYRPGVKTERGVEVGSTRERVLAAYPDGFSRTVTGGDSTFYVIDSATGQLQIEIVDAEPFSETVFSLISTELSPEVYGAYATDVALGRCVNG